MSPNAQPRSGRTAAVEASTATTSLGRRLARGFRAEGLRTLHDPLALAGAAAALALPVLLQPLYPEGLTAADLDGVAPLIGASLLQYLIILAAVIAGIRSAQGHATGRQGRTILLLGHLPAEVCRAGVAALLGAAFGLVAVILPAAAHLLNAAGALARTVPPTDAPLIAAAVAGLAAGVWGDVIGRLVRAPLIVPLAVLATLSPAALLVDAAPMLVGLTPLGALLAAVGAPLSLDAGPTPVPFGVLLAVLWPAAASIAALLLGRRRGALP